MKHHPNFLAVEQIGRCVTRLSLNASSYTTVCMAVERALGKTTKSNIILICNPYKRSIGMGAISTVTSFKITGIGFPMASLRWGKRKVWMYLLPVIAWSIVVNIPEIYTTVAYFTDIKVNINYLSTSRKYLFSIATFCYVIFDLYYSLYQNSYMTNGMFSRL